MKSTSIVTVIGVVCLLATKVHAVNITIDGGNCTCISNLTTVSAYKDANRTEKLGERTLNSGISGSFQTTACPASVEVKTDSWGLTSYLYYYFSACKNIRVTLTNNSTCTNCNSSAVEE